MTVLSRSRILPIGQPATHWLFRSGMRDASPPAGRQSARVPGFSKGRTGAEPGHKSYHDFMATLCAQRPDTEGCHILDASSTDGQKQPGSR